MQSNSRGWLILKQGLHLQNLAFQKPRTAAADPEGWIFFKNVFKFQTSSTTVFSEQEKEEKGSNSVNEHNPTTFYFLIHQLT